MDAEAAKVVLRLVRHGYQAYLVGGCVRDLLLGRTPKDFDVATSALPEEVRTLFRNSRVIGRRFRLVHVLFSGGKIIETATFRRSPSLQERTEDDLLIRSDNVFGEADEDAARRDFTINALFYDLERKQVLDWCDGMPDIQGRAVQIIGNPVVRFREDPVRILRAIKFSARLDLGIAPEVYHAMVGCRDALEMAARPRLFEELLRLLRGGAAQRSFWLAWETGVLDVLLPEVSAYLTDLGDENDEPWRILRELDRRQAERPLDDVALWALLLLGPMREACAGQQDRIGAAFEYLEPIAERLAVPRRISDGVRRIIAMLPRLEAGKPGRFGKSLLYPIAEQVHEVFTAAAPDRDVEGLHSSRRKKRRRGHSTASLES